MSLSRALIPGGERLSLPGEPPFAVADLAPLRGEPFMLPVDDPWVKLRGDEAHGYLDAARSGWVEHPEYMDFEMEGSPCHWVKRAERDLYLTRWARWLDAERFLDIGCGIGRMGMPLLERGADVFGVDADLDSLRHFAWKASWLGAGRLELSWSSAVTLPDIEPVDVVLAVEVWCYVPDPAAAVAAAVARLKPGGVLLMSVEARYGWAASPDAGGDSWQQALDGDGYLRDTHQGNVRTYTEDDVRSLLEGAGLEVQEIVPTNYVLDGPLEQTVPEGTDIHTLLDIEARCASHPVWGPLNRVWSAVAIKPAT